MFRKIALLLLFVGLLSGQPAPQTDLGEKPDPKKKALELLDAAAQMAGSTPDVQAAVLFHLGEGYQGLDAKKSKELFQQAFAAAGALPDDRVHNKQREQARIVQAVVEEDLPEAILMLRQMEPAPGMYDPRWPAVDKVVRKLVQDSRLDEAIEVVENTGSTGFYSFTAASVIFQALPADDGRRVTLFASATSAYTARPHSTFVTFLADSWQGVSKQMADAALSVLLRQILDHKDDGTYNTRGYATAKGTVTFKSEQDAQLFDVMYVVREINPKRADEILEQRPDLRAWLNQYPKGRESLRGGGGSFSFMAMGSDQQSVARASERGRSWLLTQSIAQAAVDAVKTDPDKAISLARSIPTAVRRAEVLGGIAGEVAEKDSAMAKKLINDCFSLLDDIKNPEDRIVTWDAMADAAHRVGDDQLVWRIVDRALSDAAELDKKYARAQVPNIVPRDYWPSAQAYRRVVTRSAKIFGVDAEPLLLKISDKDINLLARIAMAQALLGRPQTDWTTRAPRLER